MRRKERKHDCVHIKRKEQKLMFCVYGSFPTLFLVSKKEGTDNIQLSFVVFKGSFPVFPQLITALFSLHTTSIAGPRSTSYPVPGTLLSIPVHTATLVYKTRRCRRSLYFFSYRKYDWV